MLVALLTHCSEPKASGSTESARRGTDAIDLPWSPRLARFWSTSASVVQDASVLGELTSEQAALMNDHRLEPEKCLSGQGYAVSLIEMFNDPDNESLTDAPDDDADFAKASDECEADVKLPRELEPLRAGATEN